MSVWPRAHAQISGVQANSSFLSGFISSLTSWLSLSRHNFNSVHISRLKPSAADKCRRVIPLNGLSPFVGAFIAEPMVRWKNSQATMSRSSKVAHCFPCVVSFAELLVGFEWNLDSNLSKRSSIASLNRSLSVASHSWQLAPTTGESRARYSNTQALLTIKPLQATCKVTRPGSWGGQKHRKTPDWYKIAGTLQPSNKQVYEPCSILHSPVISTLAPPSG